MKKIILFAALTMAALLPVRFAAAQGASYPNKPIRLVVTFSPGGSVDIMARIIAPKLAEKLGQPVVVENRSGASGIIGTEIVAHSKPDGYTLMMHTIPFVANQHLYKKLSYDPIADFAPISLIASSPSVLMVNPVLKVKSVQELTKLAKSKPGELNYAAAGAGTNPHIAGELFNSLGKIEIMAIQYRGGGPALTAALGGEVGIIFSNISEAAPIVKSGKLNALAVTGTHRSKIFPELPTVAEAGIDGYEFSTWHGLLAPKGTPKEIVNKINQNLVEAIRSPEITERFAQMGLDVIASTPDQFAAHLVKESKKWGQVIKDRKISVE